MQHTFSNHLFLHLPCIKVLCLSRTSVFFAGHLPPPECHRVLQLPLCICSCPSVCLYSVPPPPPRPPHLSFSQSLSLDVSTSLIVLHIIHKPKHPYYFSTNPILLFKLPGLFTQIHPPPRAPPTACSFPCCPLTCVSVNGTHLLVSQASGLRTLAGEH